MQITLVGEQLKKQEILYMQSPVCLITTCPMDLASHSKYTAKGTLDKFIEPFRLGICLRLKTIYKVNRIKAIRLYTVHI